MWGNWDTARNKEIGNLVAMYVHVLFATFGYVSDAMLWRSRI
jgi:hypothetical protein